MGELAHHLALFLNHLCDGEHDQIKELALAYFLNHLCDGEQLVDVIGKPEIFLNHLCDGERAFLPVRR